MLGMECRALCIQGKQQLQPPHGTNFTASFSLGCVSSQFSSEMETLILNRKTQGWLGLLHEHSQ